MLIHAMRCQLTVKAIYTVQKEIDQFFRNIFFYKVQVTLIKFRKKLAE